MSTMTAAAPTYDRFQLAGLQDMFSVLARASKAVRRLDTEACNRELTPREDKRRSSIIRKAANVVAMRTGGTWTVYHQSDPRGCSLYLVPDSEDHPFDTMDYTSVGIAL